jgi:hypothetical protein
MEEEHRLAQAEDVRMRVLRGDLLIGILAPEEVHAMVATLRELGRAGAAGAWLSLARYHLDENGLHWDPRAAVEACGRAAVQGSGEARRWFPGLVQSLRAEGIDDPAGAGEVVDGLRAALPTDEDGAVHHLMGICAWHGFGCPRDPGSCRALQEQAAALGHADAMFELYAMWATGGGGPEDEAVALGWCMRAADHGQARAMYNLGTFYASGRGGVEQDEAQARVHYGRASAAGHGRATAMLAYMTMLGDGGPADPERAEELFRLAGEQGFEVESFRDQVGV